MKNSKSGNVLWCSAHRFRWRCRPRHFLFWRKSGRGRRGAPPCRCQHRPCRISHGTAVADQIEAGESGRSHESAADPVHRPSCAGSFQACCCRAAGWRNHSERNDAAHRAAGCAGPVARNAAPDSDGRRSCSDPAANNQVQIENTRVEAERRRLAQNEIEARARLEEATHDLGRSQRLYEKKAYSAKALESMNWPGLSRLPSLKQFANSSRRCRRCHHQIRRRAPNYDVRSPIAGTIVRVKQAGGNRSRPATRSSKSWRWIPSGWRRRSLRRISEGSPEKGRRSLRPRLSRIKEFQGRLINLGKVVDEQSRTATAIFEVTNPSEELRIGMQANLRLDGGTQRTGASYPQGSRSRQRRQEDRLRVCLSGEEFERRNVVLGDEYGGTVAILSGVKAGERVVTQGAYQLKLQELRPANAGAHTHEV